MFGLIISISIVVAAIIAGIILFLNSKRIEGFATIIAGIIVSCVIIVGCCTATIKTGYTGIVTTFGKVEDVTLDAGLRWKLPWQKVVRMENRVQKETVELQTFSSDIQEVSMKYTVNYQIDKTNAMNIYRTIGSAYYDTVIAPAIAESVKTISAQFTAEELVECRDKLALGIENLLSDNLAAYNINIVSTSVEDLDFTDVFTDAVEAKQVAQQNKLKAQTEAEQRIIEAEAQAEVEKVNADAAAQVKKINADAEAYEITAKANAEADANKKVNASITTELIDYVRANQWDGKLPTYYGGEGTAILDLTD